MPTELSADEARRAFRDLIDRAHYRDETTTITKFGHPWAAVVSAAQLSGLRAELADLLRDQLALIDRLRTGNPDDTETLAARRATVADRLAELEP